MQRCSVNTFESDMTSYKHLNQISTSHTLQLSISSTCTRKCFTPKNNLKNIEEFQELTGFLILLEYKMSCNWIPYNQLPNLLICNNLLQGNWYYCTTWKYWSGSLTDSSSWCLADCAYFLWKTAPSAKVPRSLFIICLLNFGKLMK